MSKTIRPGDPAPTPQQIDTIVLWLAKGAIPDTALARAGVPRSIYQRWLRAGAEGIEPYASFAAKVDAAVILFECKLLDMIAGQMDRSLAAAQWLFSMKFGPKYKREAEREAGIVSALPMATQPQVEASEAEIEAAERRALAAQKDVEQQRPKALKFGLDPHRINH